MKMRTGFVSNSSSSCFILDLRTDGVRELVDRIEATVGRPLGLDRCSAIAVGDDFACYSREFHAEYEPGEKWAPWSFMGWMKEWLDNLGENVVFIRASDEGMGGWVPEDEVGKLAVSEMEYH